MTAGVFQPIEDTAVLTCILGGGFVYDTYSANVTFDTTPVALEGGEWASDTPPCTKKASTQGALPDCKTFLPAVTLALFTTVEGSKPLVMFSIQFAKENMIPAFLYDVAKPNVTVT